MSEAPKKRFFLNHKKSSALVVSVIIHAVFIVVALTFVAVQVYIKPEQTFEVKNVQRPKMKLRKLQVPVKQQKRSQAPKLRKTIVTKTKTKMDIKMPEIVGVKGGIGSGSGTGLGGLGMGLGLDLDLFGGSGGKGNEFIGTLYDMRQTSDGELTDIGKELEGIPEGQYPSHEGPAIELIKNFMSGWNVNRLDKLFKAPKLKYTTSFYMPYMKATEAPKAFGVEGQVQPSFWLCLYKGQIAAPETGYYRFCGLGDDVLSVRVKGKLVLDACWPNKVDWNNDGKSLLSGWKSDDPENRKFPMDPDKVAWYSRDSRMVIGDWFPLKKGERVDMEVLISEFGGYAFSARLLVQQKGKVYKTVSVDGEQRPVLPIFKTAPINEKLIPMMNIDPNIATVDGPSFGVLENAPQKTSPF